MAARHGGIRIGEPEVRRFERASLHRHRLVAHIGEVKVCFVNQRRCRAPMVRRGQKGAELAVMRPLRLVHLLADIGVARDRMRAEAIELTDDRTLLRHATDGRAEALALDKIRGDAEKASTHKLVAHHQAHETVRRHVVRIEAVGDVAHHARPGLINFAQRTQRAAAIAMFGEGEIFAAAFMTLAPRFIGRVEYLSADRLVRHSRHL